MNFPLSPANLYFFLPLLARWLTTVFTLGVFVQMADPGDDVTDARVTWPDTRTEIPFGTITLTARVDDQAPERRKIIF